MIFQKVLLTGAAGGLGRVLRPALRKELEFLRSTDINPMDPPEANEETIVADLADPTSATRLVEGIEAIVHFGGISTEADFESIERVNIAGMYHLYEAARLAGVKRVVFASSNHAIGFYPQSQVIDTAVPQRPDTFYGLSKAFGENLASLYWDKHGIETVSIRIGSSFPEPTDRRMLLTWLSYGDLIQLVSRALTAPRVGNLVVYGVSDNAATFWDNRLAGILGYKAADSSEAYREKVFANTPVPDKDEAAMVYQGGVYTL
ncbi:MAG: NAD(P)-dependent oxidoreductase [Bauldia sp.]|nr:NAD(P)-dependent oxidoreductase [Bauldia sp.]